MRYSSELAEFIGIMLGDGNLRRASYRTRIFGHFQRDKDYLLYHVKPLAKKLFKKEFHVHSLKNNCLYLDKCSKEIYLVLKHYGLKEGNKKLNNVRIPSWILKSKKYTKACIRGLIDTDGSVTNNSKRTYSYIWFKCGISNLRKSFSKAIKILGLETAKWNGATDTKQTYFARKEMIKKYYLEIGFNNPKHEKKFRRFF